MVLKKLGDELMEEYIDVLRFLGEDEGMTVIVEPHEHMALVGGWEGREREWGVGEGVGERMGG